MASRESIDISTLAYEAYGQYLGGQVPPGAGGGQTGEEGNAALGFEQLEFSFTADLRALSLTRFRERTQYVEEGLEGPRRARFSEQRQAVAARFELSIRISSAALEGFASAAEGSQDDGNALDRLLALTESLQAQADAFFNETLSLLNDFFSGGTDALGFAESLNKLFDDLFAGFFGGGAALPAAGANDATSGTQVSLQQLEFSFSFSAVAVNAAVEGEVQQGDPLVFDLDGDGIELTSYKDGARFDLLGDGRQVNTAFVTGGDAFLARDQNGNGLIDDGRELFGEQNGASNGFEELRKLDANGDHVIDARDASFADLRLFRDNGNGITEPGELISLAEAGITRIELDYRDVRLGASGGNVLSQLASYQRADGSRGTAADALLNFTA